jgi:NAD-dependent DNA ligase
MIGNSTLGVHVKATKQKQTVAPILTAMLGKKIVFNGKFAFREQERLAALTEGQQGIVLEDLDSSVDYLVLADATAGKTIQKKAASLNAKGATIQVLDAN